MSEAYDDRASALLKDLKGNGLGSGTGSGSSSTGKTSLSVVEGGKKKKSKRFLILLPVLLLLVGAGGYVGMVYAGVVRNKQIETLLHLKRKDPGSALQPKPTEENPVEKDPTPPDKPPVVAKVSSPKATIDPAKGNLKEATIWSEMEPEAIVKLAPNYKDPELALILGAMDPDKVAAILTLLDPKRSAKVSKLINQNASVVPPVDDN